MHLLLIECILFPGIGKGRIGITRAGKVFIGGMSYLLYFLFRSLSVIGPQAEVGDLGRREDDNNAKNRAIM